MDVKLQLDSPFLTRLLDVVASGIGAVFRPWMIRRLARANADATLIEAKAEWDVRLLEVAPEEPEMVPKVEVISMPTDQSASPGERTKVRLQLQEEKRQRNIELVVWHAASEPGSPPPAQPPDDDWVARFFGAVQDVSAEELQILWGRILAGEIRRPGSFSLRTLEHLRNLTRHEAEMFMAVSGCFEEETGVLIFGAESNRLLPPVARLVEAGLLHARSMWSLRSGRPMTLRYLDGAVTVILRGPGFMDRFDPTQSAGELLSVIQRSPLPGYLEALKLDLIRAGYTLDTSVKLTP